MKTQLFKLNLIALAGLTAVTSACSLGDPKEDPPVLPPDAGPRPDARPPIDPPDLPEPFVYKRGSLRPLYQLTPIGDQQRFDIFDVSMTNADFQAQGALGASVAQKMAQIQFQLATERGVDTDDPQAEIFQDFENETRAQTIPFRGNPTDVKFMEFEGRRKAFVPLGGDVMTVGHEVAIVDLDNTDNVARVSVGLHPQRLFAHEPSGLVFVCNQFSNYISIIDSRTNDLLRSGGVPVEIPTDYYCTDLALVERANFGEQDELHLYVANEYRASVMRYAIDIVRDGIDDVDTVEIITDDKENPHIPEIEIQGVGRNPLRLVVNADTEDEIYVMNGRGGEAATIRIPDGEVVRTIAFRAPTTDAVQVRDKLYIPTLTPFRGYPNIDAEAEIPEDIQTEPVRDPETGEIVHPGALFDDTDSYNFEDLRNGIFEIDTDLGNREVYMTDDNEVDDFFDDIQKIVEGSIPYDIERNEAGNRVYVVWLGNDVVQELSVVGGAAFRLRNDGNIYNTAELPMAVALDEDAGILMVANYGDDTLQLFNLDNANLLETIDLGYGEPNYPATTIELGEYAYATAKWANDGRKACTTCHWDRFLVDGIEYGNGATASTMPHQVKPNYNLLETDNYFWNGSFTNNSYASLAFQAQARTNCELILFSLVEGADSDPAQRVGDPANFTADAATDPICRPDTLNLDPANDLPTSLEGDANGDGVADFNDIADVINAQKQVEFAATGVALQVQLDQLGRFDNQNGQNNRDEISRAMDYYGAAELRLPPNPLNQMYELGVLASNDVDKIEQGRDIFAQIGCTGCHNPTNADGAFADARDHGRGADFFSQFFQAYSDDDRLLGVPGLEAGIPQQFIQATSRDFTDAEINFFEEDQDSFQPFSFDSNLQLRFENPLAASGDEETRRLVRLALINLADPDRGFLPGNVVGQQRVNTPSLRGVWLQPNLLRHGLAINFREAILAPGHPALKPGERGFAVDFDFKRDVHGRTQALSPADVDALEFYLRSIE